MMLSYLDSSRLFNMLVTTADDYTQLMLNSPQLDHHMGVLCVVVAVVVITVTPSVDDTNRE